MRQNRLIWAILALGILSLALSCQREKEMPTTNESQVQVRTFTCTIAGGDESRVSIDAEGKTRWVAGDKILIHGERIGTSGGKQYSTIVTLAISDISSDGKTATISVATDPDGVEGIVPYVRSDYESSLYAAYPAEAVTTESLHCYYHSVFVDTNVPLMVAYDKGDSFIFTQAGSVISFTLPSTVDFDSYVFSGNDGEIVGYDRFTVKTSLKTDGTESTYFPYTGGDVPEPVSGEKTQVIGPVVCDGTTLNQVFLPGKVTFNRGFKILFVKDGDVVQYASNKNAFTLRRGECISLGDISSHLKTYVPTHSSAIPTEGAIDLGASETANSYLVPATSAPGAVYKFKAVKGNSAESVGTIAFVDVLWETWNNAEAVTRNSVVAAADFEGEYVYFQMPESLHAGNAVLAAKNGAGTILWSWHIWVPATEIVTANYGIYPAPMMDRNLGALVASTADAAAPVESFGLTYQWGRKDPFPGAKAVSSNDNATVAGVAVSVTDGIGEADESKISLEQSIQNPTLLGHAQNADWLLPSDNTRWKNDLKTMYDPCPPGYRVPARETESAFHSSDLSAATGWQENAGNYWFALGDPLAVFPFAGYRDDYSPGSLSHAYDRGAYWTAYSSQDAKAYYVNVRAGSSHSRTEGPKSRAISVRCVSTSGQTVDPVGDVVDLSASGTANSYIVTAAGNYKFKAVKGNSAEPVGAVVAVELLWETVNTATAPAVNDVIAQFGIDGDYITFSTPGTLKPGNALIAAKDGAGVVLWSWHIWIPETAVAIIDAEAFCGAKMMDRNLGALVATSMTGDPDPRSIGNFYQWGRKDPFPGMASFTSNSAAKVVGTAWSSHGELENTAYSIANPTEYIHVPDVDAGVWNADDPKDLWNTADNGKTVYDPCPAGYRVPRYSSSLPMWSGTIGDGWTVDQANYRFAYGENVFPVAGYIDCWTPSYEKVGLRTHIWAASWYDGERSNCLYYREGTYYSQKFHKAKAGSVRCVKE